jgi:hypothetical protein
MNLALSIVFVQFLGLKGVVIGTLFSNVFLWFPYSRLILRTFNRESEVKYCDLIFRYNDGWWESDISRCEIPEKNISLETYIKFNGTEYFSRDAAYSIETNEFLWGKKKEQGEFHFFKHDK